MTARLLVARGAGVGALLTLCLTTRASAQPTPRDSSRALPALDESKRLSSEELAAKREGRFVTGAPAFEANPVNGYGYGATLFVFENGRRDDPLFAYTPYRSQVGVDFLVFPSGRTSFGVTADLPYVRGTPYRVRLEAGRHDDPNQQYFGFGTTSMRPLSLVDPLTGQSRTFRRFDEYEAALQASRAARPSSGEPAGQLVTDVHRNEVQFNRTVVALGVERAYFGGRMRAQVGYEFQLADIRPYDGELVRDAVNPVTGATTEAVAGRSRFTDSRLGEADGWARFNVAAPQGNQRVALLQGGVMYDTRDFEPDPSRGVLASYSLEVSAPVVASEYTFTKQLVETMAWIPVLQRGAFRSVLAQRLSVGRLGGSSVPLSETWDTWSAPAYGGIEAVGGAATLRGFRAGRFRGPVMGYGSLELRNRVAKGRALRQHLTLELTPFADAGRVWDAVGEVGLRGWRTSLGAGARIGWNQSTVVRIDRAVSREGAQTFVVFGHAF
jgi:outer membrane protein assembly factor BamA